MPERPIEPPSDSPRIIRDVRLDAVSLDPHGLGRIVSVRPASGNEPPSDSDIGKAKDAVVQAAVDFFAFGKRDAEPLAAAVLAYLKVVPDAE